MPLNPQDAAIEGPRRLYPQSSLQALISSQAARTPDAIAFRHLEANLSYAALEVAANRVGQWLKRAGIGRGDLVAVFTLRDLDWPVAILGVLKSGAAYVPLDSQYPDDRLDFILKDSGAKALITQTGLQSRFSSVPSLKLCLDEPAALASLPATDPDAETRFEDPCWALYTSGSTGKPKGALLHRHAIGSFYDWFASTFGITAETRTLLMTSPGFDLTQRMTLMPLTRGATVVLAPTEHYDAAALLDTIERERIDVLSCTPSGLYGLLDDASARTWQQLQTLRLVVPGGEIIQGTRLKPWASQPLFKAEIHNSYGPTETHDLITTYRLQPEDFELAQVRKLGKPLANVELRILDEAMQPVPVGTVGTLYVAGLHVGLGYLNLPGKTAEAFVLDPIHPGARLYKVGDLVRCNEDEVIEFVGRADHQVKVRGWRIELPEIEGALLTHPQVREAVVTAPADASGERRLIAYVQPREGAALDPALLRAHLGKTLPEYMLPGTFVLLERFPVNANGKVDRTHLPEPVQGRPVLTTAYAPPIGAVEQKLATMWEALLGFNGVGRDDRFFELGGTSLMATQFVGRLGHLLGERLPVAGFFAAPTLARYAEQLQRKHPEALTRSLGHQPAVPHIPEARPSPSLPPMPAPDQPAMTASIDIAIVGLACRLPDADTPDAFWQNLAAGREALRSLSDAELIAAGVAPEVFNAPDYVRRTGVLADAYAFDAGYFGYTPREAQLMDPQHRVLLECAHHALEHAGIAPGSGAKIGVFTGVAHNAYFSRNLASHADLRSGDGFSTVIGGDKDFTATRIAFKLDLTGPAVGVQAACATSGIALHLACQAIRSGDCEAAIIGGARVNTPQGGYVHVDGGPESSDGHIRAFAAKANGMVLTSGAACVVVKRLDKALIDGDRVYAVVKGTAINNDGADKIAYTAPSEAGQTAVIRAALAAAGVSADSVSYIETHGTGTALGDPIEVAALAQGYIGAATGSIAIGSVKTNVGHLDAGAGAISLVKTALSLSNKAIPASLHCETPNPECGFERTPFFVNTQFRDWRAAAPRRAGVSSFGFGGTNFHAVLEEAPVQATTAPRRKAQVVRLSAKTDATLGTLASRLADQLEAQPQLSLADVAYTLDVGRERHARRIAVSAADTASVIAQLRATLSPATPAARPSLVFLFPGQGAQHVDMGRALYEREPVFRAAVDACAIHLELPLGLDLRAVLYPAPEQAAGAAETLKSTQLAQPAIFTISYATAKLWESWGLVPDAMLGHSVGEFVAATLAGVFELEHALLILAERARLMNAMPAGGMLAVRLPEADILAQLPETLAIAALNAPQLTIVSGPQAALDAFAATLTAAGVGTSALHTSHAFHSAMMEPAVAPFAAVVAQYPRRAPTRKIVSSLTGTWVEPETLQDPQYWAQQLRSTVRFAPALGTLLAIPGRVLLEVGPGQNLSTSARQQLQGTQGAAVASLPHAGQASADAQAHVLEALGKLWCAGIETVAARFYAGEKRLKVGLPGMPFARTVHYIAPAVATAEVHPPQAAVAAAPASAAVVEVVADSPVEESKASKTLAHLVKLMVNMTGLDFAPENHAKTFLELGLDSLMLTQVVGKLKAEFKVDLKFRQLMEDYTSISTLAAYLTAHASGTPGLTATAAKAVKESNAPDTVIKDADGKPKTFGAGAKISKVKGEQLTDQQEAALAELTARYIAKSGKSKAYAQEYRDVLADPRTVSGFRPLLKELIYPIVTPKSKGAYLWDLDDNQYIDVTCGFGSMFFGHRAPFVVDAVEHQMRHMGYEIGPQSPLAGECARMIAEFTGLPRVAFCATGSEAVLAAMRTARTVTGKNLIVMFNGDYHGMFDEVIFRGTASLRTLPAAPGIPPESVANTLILDFGSEKALQIIEERADEIAAVIVEPVQSRRCDFQPRDFLLKLRELTTRINAAYVFDEIVTGFRASLGGGQGYYGIQADMASYGKVVGGGMSIGIIAGVSKFMDALDGGAWQFGDDSVPEVGVTYFAGTFVRHPLSLAACKAVCEFLKANPGIYADVNRRTARMVDTINFDLRKANAPLHIAHFTSLWKPEYTTDQPFGDLLYMYLREANIHIWDGRPCFLSIAHTDADAEAVIEAFRYAVAQMQKGGFFTGSYKPTEVYFSNLASPYRPPLPEARIGRDEDGNPAWYVPDPAGSGRFVPVEMR